MPATFLGVIGSAGKDEWAKIMTNIGIVAVKTDARPDATCCCPQNCSAY
jgi:hypothetical protein